MTETRRVMRRRRITHPVEKQWSQLQFPACEDPWRSSDRNADVSKTFFERSVNCLMSVSDDCCRSANVQSFD
jgi:hypothetical protein